jgi:hypothetical protein
MIHVSAIAESIVAPKLFRPGFSHSLDPMPKLVTLCVKLVKIGAKVVHHGRYVTFQLAEVAAPRELFRKILRMIDYLRPRPAPA